MSEQAAAVPVGEWSATPPTVPGWYWWREAEHEVPSPREVWFNAYLRGLCSNMGGLARAGGEWWSVPIQPPGA